MSSYGKKTPQGRVADFNFDFSGLDDPSRHNDERKRLYGIIPEDFLPDFYKEGYNNSIEGMAYQMVTGKQFFEIDHNYNPGMVRDIMATISSFLTPTDILTMATGGGLAAKALNKYGTKAAQTALRQTNLPKHIVAEMTEAGMKDAAANASRAQIRAAAGLASDVGKMQMRAAVGAGGFGFYSGLQSAELQVLQDRDKDHIQGLADASKSFAYGFGKGSVHGAAIGAVTGGLGQLGRMAGRKATSRLSPRSQNAAAIGGDKGIEIAAFGTLPSIEDAIGGEFRLPRAEEWIHAAGVVGGLGASRGALKLRKDVADRYRQKEMDAISPQKVRAEKRKGAGEYYDKISQVNIGEEVWIDPTTGTKIKIRSQDFYDTPVDWKVVPEHKKSKNKDYTDLGGLRKTRNDVEFTILEVGKNYKSSGEGSLKNNQKRKMLKRDFLETFTRQTDPVVKKGKTISQSLSDGWASIKKKLKISDKTHQADLRKLGIPESGPTNSQQHRAILEHYKRKEFISSFVKDKATDAAFRSSLVDIHRDGVLKERLPEPLYNVLAGFKQVKNRLTHPFSQYSKEKMLNADFAAHHELSIVLNSFEKVGIGGKKGPTSEQYTNLYDIMTNKKYQGGKGLDYKDGKLIEVKTGKVIDIDIGGVNPAGLRNALDGMYYKAKQAGVPVKKYTENYMPQLYRTEVLEVIRKDIESIMKNNRKYQRDLFSLNPEKPAEVEVIIRKFLGLDKKGKQIGPTEASPETIKSFQHLMRQFQNSPHQALQAFNKLKTEGWALRYDIAYNLEKSRVLDLPPEFLEKNVGKLMARYASQYSKRKAAVENFGKKNERIGAALEMLREQNRHGEADILDKAFSSFTGNIETDPRFNYTPYWKNAWNNMTQFQVATKIGLGFGAVVNLTQPFISTAVALGYGPMINGMKKFKTDSKYRKAIEKRIGYNNMDILKQIFGSDYTEIGMFGKFANATTTYLGFNGINKWNYNSAAATMYEYLLKQQQIAKGGKFMGKTKVGRERARAELRRHGLTEKSNLSLENTSSKTQKKITRAMYEFARDSQLQKNVLNDPLFFNDPRFRPFVLFKRFGYKQANWIAETLKKEWVEYKNPMPVLRLVAGGFAGGLMMNTAKQFITKVLSGEDVYNENYSLRFDYEDGLSAGVKKLKNEITVGEILDTAASAGAFGLVADIISAEDKLQSAEFLAKPAVLSDAEKIYDTVIRFYKESGEFGLDAAVRRVPSRASRLLGAFPARLASRLQTKQQKESYLTFRKGIIKNRILDALTIRNNREAMKILKEWNNAYPEKRITYEDISISAVIDRYKKRLERRREVQLDLPPR